jgi:hypothetical protein
MEASEFSSLLNTFSENVINELSTINEKMALNAYALVKNRIINEGTIGEGKSLGSYSDNELPAFYFKDKAINSSGEEFYLSAKKEGKGISYKNWRRANNLPTDHKTLSFTGDTLKDIGVVKSINEGTKIITIVGPKNTKRREGGKTTSDIAGYLQDQVGDFLAPNNEEQKILAGILNSELNKIVKASFK